MTRLGLPQVTKHLASSVVGRIFLNFWNAEKSLVQVCSAGDTDTQLIIVSNLHAGMMRIDVPTLQKCRTPASSSLTSKAFYCIRPSYADVLRGCNSFSPRHKGIRGH